LGRPANLPDRSIQMKSTHRALSLLAFALTTSTLIIAAQPAPAPVATADTRATQPGWPDQLVEPRAWLPWVGNRARTTAHPGLLAALYGGESSAVARVGAHAVWVVGAWLAVVDVADPAAPRAVGMVRTGPLWHMVTQGNLVYGAGGGVGSAPNNSRTRASHSSWSARSPKPSGLKYPLAIDTSTGRA